jgi:acyl CoA:acetate/3-ketoacid CoA transferase
MGTTYICSKCSESISDTENFIFNGEHNEYVCEKCCFKDNDTVEELTLTEIAKGIAVQIIDELYKEEVQPLKEENVELNKQIEDLKVQIDEMSVELKLLKREDCMLCV